MADTLLTPTVIANEANMQLENNTVWAVNVHRDYQDEFVKIGSSITYRKPVQFTANDGPVAVLQDVVEASDTITISQDKHVAWDFTVKDLTLTIENYKGLYLRPGMIAMADVIDKSIADLYTGLYISAGTAGITPASFAALGTIAQYLDDNSVPEEDRRLMLNPAAHWSMADALKNLYSMNRAEKGVNKGWLGQIANFDIYNTQKAPRHTTGSAVATSGIQVTSAVSDAYSATVLTSAVNINATTLTGTFKAGDVFTIAGVFSVNPVSKVSTGRLQDFTVTADATAAANAAALTVSPRIIASGAYQTVSAGAAANAAVTFRGSNSTTYAQNLAFNKNCIALVMIPLQVPTTSDFTARVNHKGYGLTIMKGFDITNRREIIRMDALWGVKVLDHRLGGRLWGGN